MKTPPDRRQFLKSSIAGSVGLTLTGPGAAQVALPGACAHPLLPQEDPNPLVRRRHLARMRHLYVYDYGRVPSLPMVENLPWEELFSPEWLRQASDRVRDLFRNFAGPPRRLPRPDAASLLDFARRSAEEASARAPDDRPGSLEDYAGLFRTIALPPIAGTFQEDRVFARQRIAGANPLMLQRVAGLDDRFPVTDAIFRAVLPGDGMEAAAAEGRLYLADYHALANVHSGLFRGVPKFVSAPLALFALEKSSRELVPVAIQCEQEPGPHNPILTKYDGHAWSIAKTIVQIADANVHEAVSHLGRTHLFVEPFVIATERQLGQNHPLRLLLRPHFQGTLAINELAHQTLLAPGGFVDELLAGTLEASIDLAVAAVRSYRFDEAMLPNTLRARGVEDPALLPDYPYRDDALLYWSAIRRWVGDYLRTYYRSPADLRDDFELAEWHRELVAGDGGRVTGFGPLEGLDDLIDAATLLVFTSSVQHAAVNFPQLDLMTYAPNMPLAGFAAAPSSRIAGEQDLLDLLPPLSSARQQIVILYLLGSIHYTRLGQYGSPRLCDGRIRGPLGSFHDELERIGEVIEERNRIRAPYRFLDPGGIPQSINI